MYHLSPEEFRDRAEPNLLNIFNRFDLESPFNPLVPERILLYGHFYEIHEDLLDAIIISTINHGESDCYFLNLWGEFDLRSSCFYIPLVDLKYAYYSEVSSDALPDFSAHIIFSCKGTWGVMMLDGSTGVLGGTTEFINSVRKIRPEVDYEVYSFLGSELVCHYHNYLWFKPILSHVYGSEKTDAMIKKIEEIINTNKYVRTYEIILQILRLKFVQLDDRIESVMHEINSDVVTNTLVEQAMTTPSLGDFQKHLEHLRTIYPRWSAPCQSD